MPPPGRIVSSGHSALRAMGQRSGRTQFTPSLRDLRSHSARGMLDSTAHRCRSLIRPAWPGAATRDENRVGPLPSPTPSATTLPSNPSPHDPRDFPFRMRSNSFVGRSRRRHVRLEAAPCSSGGVISRDALAESLEGHGVADLRIGGPPE
jgi:hypothetical protein